MKFSTVCKHLATLGPIGYIPPSGTWATLITVPLVYYLSTLHLPLFVWISIIVSIILFSVPIIGTALPFFRREKDPSAIVLDELIGTLVTFCAIPFNWAFVISGFLLFRAFDIVKPFGIKRCERLPGAWGIIMDDVIAGLLANIIMRVAYEIITR